MKNVLEGENGLSIIKEGSGDEIFLISPFYPFNHELIRSFLFRLKKNNQLYLFSNLTLDNNSSRIFLYDSLLTYYQKIIENYPGKKINLITFGIFANLFLDLTLFYKEKIKSLIFIEPDFNDVIFKRIFEMNDSRLFRYKHFLNFYLEDFKYPQLKSYLNKIDFKYLYQYYQSYIEYKQKYNIKDLIDYIPERFEHERFFQQIINKVISPNDKRILLLYYQEQKNGDYLLSGEITEQDKMRIREILTNLNLLTKVSIFWKIMARETWPLPQILRDMNVSHFLLNQNVVYAFNEENEFLMNHFFT